MLDEENGTPRVRTGQTDMSVDREKFDGRFDAHFYDPAFDVVRQELDRVRDVAWDGYTSTARARARGRPGQGFADPDFELPVEWLARAARDPRRASSASDDPRRRARILLVCGARAQRPDLPGRDVEDVSPGAAGAQEVDRRERRLRGRLPRSQPAHRGVRPRDLSVQGLRLDGDAALPLAVLVLPEPRDGPDRATG